MGFVLLSFGCLAQKDVVSIRFVPEVMGEVLVASESYFLDSKSDSVRIDVLKFYMSNVKLMLDDSVVFDAVGRFVLVDISDTSSLSVLLNVEPATFYNKIKFDLGIDSTTNLKGALGGALDPTLGMYWAWHSGYINFKLEGTSKECKSRKNKFQYHIGGYAGKLNAIQTNSFEVYPNNKYTLSFNFLPMLQYALAQKQFELMSPQLKAVQLAKLLSENTTCTKVQNLSNE
jgi:hypothetical protein